MSPAIRRISNDWDSFGMTEEMFREQVRQELMQAFIQLAHGIGNSPELLTIVDDPIEIKMTISMNTEMLSHHFEIDGEYKIGI
jgi:hypothetical protein